MKTQNFILPVLLFLSLTAGCQTPKEVPSIVNSAFSEKFPGAEHVSWSRENDNEWEAEFLMGKTDYSANFDLSGTWLETEYKISLMDIPDPVKKALLKETDLAKVKTIEVSETKDGKTFEFVVKDGKVQSELVIDEDGNITKKD